MSLAKLLGTNVSSCYFGNLMKTIGVVILTLNAEKHLPLCMGPLLKTSLNPQILVVDSASTDRTVEIALQYQAEVLSIDQEDFNHGLTREMARKKLATDIVIFLTPDAYAVTSKEFEKLAQPLIDGQASIAYGRQIPHENAGFFESFHRAFNYPEKGEVRCIANLSCDGPATYFFSDSFSAYSNQALDEIGGFKAVVLGEDTLAAAELIRKGHKLAYVAEAVVRHSHNYNLRQEFSRYFDAGIMRKEYEHILDCSVGDRKRGEEYFRRMMRQLMDDRPSLLPYAFLHILAKWSGYQLGQKSGNAPLWWKRMMSSQKYFWKKNRFS
jgi:rhamnosyltransferase